MRERQRLPKGVLPGLLVNLCHQVNIIAKYCHLYDYCILFVPKAYHLCRQRRQTCPSRDQYQACGDVLVFPGFGNGQPLSQRGDAESFSDPLWERWAISPTVYGTPLLKMRIFRKLPPNGGICDRFLEGVGRMNISLQNHRRLTIEKAVRMKTSDGSFHGPTFGRDVSGSVDPLVKPNYIKISNFKNLGFTCSTRSHPISTACNVYPGLITPLSVSLGGSHFSSKSSVLGAPP